MLAPHEQRVVDEYEGLAEKILKLDQFIAENPAYERLGEEDKILLREQLSVMDRYAELLLVRLARFPQGVY